MSQTVISQSVAARPIRTLILRPDDTYELREIEQDIETFQAIVGGWVEGIPTQHCCFWHNEDAMYEDAPRNMLATFLWWKLCPPVAEQVLLRGTVFVTGSAEGEWCEPVLHEVVELFERIEQIVRETEEG